MGVQLRDCGRAKGQGGFYRVREIDGTWGTAIDLCLFAETVLGANWVSNVTGIFSNGQCYHCQVVWGTRVEEIARTD